MTEFAHAAHVLLSPTTNPCLHAIGANTPGWSAVQQGHLADVAAVSWTRDDTRLVSIGGSHLYHWNTHTWQRIADQELCDKTLVKHLAMHEQSVKHSATAQLAACPQSVSDGTKLMYLCHSISDA